MKLSILAVIVGVAIIGGDMAHAAAPSRSVEAADIRRAVFDDGKLWLLSGDGRLSSVKESTSARVDEAFTEAVLDLCALNGHLIALTCAAKCRAWTVRRRNAGIWSIDDVLETQGDDFVGMTCDDHDLTILTTRRLIESNAGQITSIALPYEIALKSLVWMLDSDEQLFVGVNQGEWGGGLSRIDRRNGEIETIEARSSTELCSGPLNSNCDPINGIEVEPWNPKCLTVPIGLVHFTPSGRLIEVCGASIRTIFSKPYQPTRAQSEDKPNGTIGFFGLARMGEAILAASLDGIYRIDANGVRQIYALPELKKVGGVGLSFDLPHIVIVWSTICGRNSICVPEPMKVAR